MLEMSMTPEMGMRVTPALLNLAQLLSLPTMALHQLVQQEITSNPALEEVEREDVDSDPLDAALEEQSRLRDAAASDYERIRLAADPTFDALTIVAAPRSLSEVLLADLHVCLPEEEYAIALLLVGSLDDQGFLTEEPENIALTLQVSPERVQSVLKRLRELGPPGIATRNMCECLLAQIDELSGQGVECASARSVIQNHLEDLGAHRYTHIARQLHISVDTVREVRSFIQQYLWPYPVQAAHAPSDEKHRIRYMQADLSIIYREGHFVVEVLQSPRRFLQLNPLYQELAHHAASLDEDERMHVQEYVGRARTFLANLRQREATLQRIGEAIVARQEEFLRYGVRHLVPMTRSEIAAELSLHESTVSRATADKAAMLPDGRLLALKEFFVAARGVQDVLRELIDTETKPLSDAELARLLSDRGYRIARRTVAKYREQMKILPSHLR